jgi:DUF4097 and DUF4098 domain-containing protein YvlB
MLRNGFKLAAAFCIATPLIWCQQTRIYSEGGKWVQETTGVLPSAKNLHVKVELGSVRVEGGPRQGIDYVIRNRASVSTEDKARRQFETYKVNASVRGDTAWVTSDWQGRRQPKFSSEFIIRVPREIESVQIQTEGGGVAATGIAGWVDARSGGGSLHVDDVAGNIRAATGGGSINIGNAGSEVNLHTGGGSIHLVSAKGKVTAETGGGSVVLVSGMQGAELETGGGGIRVEHCAGRLKVSTGGGSIDLGDIAGPVDIETGGGSIRLISADGPVHAETGGGTIELNGVPSANAETGAGCMVVKFRTAGNRHDSVLHTGAGDITVYLPASLGMTVRAAVEAANGHSIHSDFPEIRISAVGGQWGPKTLTAEGNLNGGGPTLKMNTTAGDIWLRSAK